MKNPGQGRTQIPGLSRPAVQILNVILWNACEELIQKKKTFMCQGYGHKPGLDTPCASEKNLLYKEAKAMLAKEAKEKVVEKD